MKKSLLLILAATAGVSAATAQFKEPVIYSETAISRISADGHYAVSEVYGTVKVMNLTSGTEVVYAASEDGTYNYSLGHGNCVSADGSIILASTLTYPIDASYLENGEWHQLNVPETEMSNLANGVTPDGSRICGSVGLNPMSFDEVIMQIPAYWDRNADGTYSECKQLPYPDKDLFGEVPQYVTAISISADGKTIVGQMQFNSGSMAIPVVYKEDAKGEWSYSLPTKSQFNPDGLEPVENPGDGPTPPNYEEFMTEEEIEAYNAAINDYYNLGTPDYPNFEDFMTEEEKAAYVAAQEAYKTVYEEWEAKWEAYDIYRTSVNDSSPNFVFNNCFISLDGKSIVSTLDSPDPNADPWSWFSNSLYTPASVDIETGDITKVNTEVMGDNNELVTLSLLVAGVANDGIMLLHNGLSSVPMLGYVAKGTELQTLVEYLNAISPEYGKWITKNMSHEVAVDYDPETWEEIFEEFTFTGLPHATPDMSLVSMYNSSPWDFMENAQSVVFELPAMTGMASVSVSDQNLKVVAKGVISVPEGFAALQVYNLNGQCVKTVSAPCGLMKLNVAPGAYIVKGVRADGSASIVKLAAN
ncbi:MAG: hypothetical protein K2H98_00690 [Duncaniella sp.]|nr:hypothetical protein [Duncaniella sp.]